MKFKSVSQRSGTVSVRWRWSAACAALLVTSVAACSSGGASSSNGAAASQTSSGAQPTTAGGPASAGSSQQPTSASNQQSGPDFYKGKTITLIVAGSAGGDMDVSARIVAPALQKAVGASAVKVLDVHGAGGVTAYNQIWTSPTDGFTVGYGSMTTLITSSLVASKSVKYDAGKFVYIGRAGLSTPQLVSVSAKAKVTNLAGLEAEPEVIFSAQGFDDGFFTAAAVSKTLGLKEKFVTGFANAAQEKEALSNGTTTALESSLAEAKSIIQSKLAVPVVMINDTPVQGYENVPLWVNSVQADMKPIAQSFQSAWDMGRSFVAPPGFPASAAAALSAGLATALQTSDVQTKMDKLGVGVSYLSASDEQAAVQQLLPVLKQNVSMMTDAMQKVQKG